LQNNVKPPSRSRKIRLTGRYDARHDALEDQYYYRQSQKQKRHNDFIHEDEIKTNGYTLKFTPGGRLVELKRTLGKKPEGLGKKKGDLIDGYSRESRNRFLKLLFSIDYKKMGTPLFYTLTYPGEYSKDPRVWKRDLDTFYKRLLRLYPAMCGTWRLEPQKRGAPHFCGFLWGCEELSTMQGKREFSRMWYEVVGSGDEKHLRAGTGIEKEAMIETRIFYMAKYQAKKEKGGASQQFDYPVGRYWGTFQREKIGIRSEEFQLDRNLFFKVRRVIKKKLEKCLTKNKFREVVTGKQNGLWISMSNEDILKLLNLIIDQEEKSTFSSTRLHRHIRKAPDSGGDHNGAPLSGASDMAMH